MFARVSCEFETNFGKLQETRRWRVRVFFLPWFPSGDFVGRGEGRVFDRDREAYIHTVSSRCWDASFVCGGASWGVYVRCFAVRFFFFLPRFLVSIRRAEIDLLFLWSASHEPRMNASEGWPSFWLLSWYARLVVRGLAVVVRPFAAQIDWVFLGAPQKAEGLKVVLVVIILLVLGDRSIQSMPGGYWGHALFLRHLIVAFSLWPITGLCCFGSRAPCAVGVYFLWGAGDTKHSFVVSNFLSREQFIDES